MILKRIGRAPSGKRLERIKKSENYKDGEFWNIEPTSVNPDNVSFFTILREILSRPKTVTPSDDLPHIKTDLFNIKDDKPTVVWFGHSSYFLSYNGYRILVDPVFSGNASPVKFFGRSFPGTNIYSAGDFPEIDLLLITHDHYDHLDYPFIKQIRSKVKKVVTSLGIGEHLEKWGVEAHKISEINWGEHNQVQPSLTISAHPTRHFSGRGISRYKTLWSSFVLEWEEYRIYVGGDSGYSSEFKRLGNQYGPFDIVFLECGQYGKYWPQIHMTPEETVQAAMDMKAKVLFPVHWGKFVLSTHPWNESIKRVTAEATKKDQKYVSPRIGEAYILGESFKQKDWWNFEQNKK